MGIPLLITTIPHSERVFTYQRKPSRLPFDGPAYIFTVKDSDIKAEAQQDAPTDPSNWSPDSSEQSKSTPAHSGRVTP